MKASTILMISTVTFFSLTGCEKKATEVVQTVDWYKEHKAERLALLEKCKSNPGELAATPNCINASRAASQITWGANKGIEVKPLDAKDLGLK
jgi:hypothetical protein